MKIKSPAYSDVRLVGFRYLDLPLCFNKPQPEYSFDVLVQEAPKSIQGSGETCMGFFKGPQKMLMLRLRDMAVFFGQGSLEPILILISKLREIPFPRRHLFE